MATESETTVRVFTLQERPDLEAQMDGLHEDAWDEFLDGASWDAWESLPDEFADLQVVVCDSQDVVIAGGHTVPLVWDGTNADLPATLDDIIERGLNVRRHGRSPTTLAALAAMVAPQHRNQGLSYVVVRAMRSLAMKWGLESVVVPVGPTLKHHYPLTPMERYMHWKRADGLPFDPWIRVHWRLGAELLCVAPTTAICTGTVAQWEAWTGMSFPESGLYVVPGALHPIEIDRERDIGRYEDPGVWMRHRIEAP
jgi:hypothetical protein